MVYVLVVYFYSDNICMERGYDELCCESQVIYFFSFRYCLCEDLVPCVYPQIL